MAAMPRTASELLLLYELLPEPEQALMLEKLTAPQSEFDDQRFTEVYKGVEIEVYRNQFEERYHGGECWTSDYTNSNGHKVNEGGIYSSAEECLKATREGITWEIQYEEMLDSFEELIQQFKAKNYTERNILTGLADALRRTLDDSSWKMELIQAVDKASKSAKLPGRGLL